MNAKFLCPNHRWRCSIIFDTVFSSFELVFTVLHIVIKLLLYWVDCYNYFCNFLLQLSVNGENCFVIRPEVVAAVQTTRQIIRNCHTSLDFQSNYFGVKHKLDWEYLIVLCSLTCCWPCVSWRRYCIAYASLIASDSFDRNQYWKINL
jgi:hypothetical protein